jgi:hypothetical protein
MMLIDPGDSLDGRYGENCALGQGIRAGRLVFQNFGRGGDRFLIYQYPAVWRTPLHCTGGAGLAR